MLFYTKMEKQYREGPPQEVFEPLDRALLEGLRILSPLSEQQVNTAPFTGSWTAGQVTRHIIKSNKSIGQALSLPGNTTHRPADQRVQELKDLFLDYSIKFQSAPFITPGRDHYDKERLVADLETSVSKLREGCLHTDLDEAIHHPAFGEITKLELLFFVLFHTQRHIHQLKKIVNL
jgi:hypothetical protein